MSRSPALPPGSVVNRIFKVSSRSAGANGEALRSIGAEQWRRRARDVDAENNRWNGASSLGQRDTRIVA
jgi:hypothetical protein